MKWRVLDQTVAEPRSKFSDLAPEALENLLEEAVSGKRWAGTLSRSGVRFGLPAPRHEFVDAVLGPTVYEARQQLGHVGQRINSPMTKS